MNSKSSNSRFFSILVTNYFSILKYFSRFWNIFINSETSFLIVKFFYRFWNFFLDSQIFFSIFIFIVFITIIIFIFFIFVDSEIFFWISQYFFFNFESFFLMAALGHHRFMWISFHKSTNDVSWPRQFYLYFSKLSRYKNKF